MHFGPVQFYKIDCFHFLLSTCTYRKVKSNHKAFVKSFEVPSPIHYKFLTRISTGTNPVCYESLIRRISQLTFTCSKSSIETIKKVWNMSKVNFQDITTISLTSPCCHLLFTFTPFLVFLLNVCWVYTHFWLFIWVTRPGFLPVFFVILGLGR